MKPEHMNDKLLADMGIDPTFVVDDEGHKNQEFHGDTVAQLHQKIIFTCMNEIMIALADHYGDKVPPEISAVLAKTKYSSGRLLSDLGLLDAAIKKDLDLNKPDESNE